MATATPEKQSGGEAASAGDESRESFRAQVWQMSDEVLRKRVEALQHLLAQPIVARIHDGGDKLRLFLGACLEELNNRRLGRSLQRDTHVLNGELPCLRAELRQMSDGVLREKVESLQYLVAQPLVASLPDSGIKLRLSLKAHLEELNNRRLGRSLQFGSSSLQDKKGLCKNQRDTHILNGELSCLRAELRQMSDGVLQEKVESLQYLVAQPIIARLPDGGAKLRLLLEARLEELNNRRLGRALQGHQNIVVYTETCGCGINSSPPLTAKCFQCNAALRNSTSSSLGEANKRGDSTVHNLSCSSKARVGDDERRQRSEAEGPQPSSDKEALWERVQRLQAQFTGPNGTDRLLSFLQACFKEVNKRPRHGAHPQTCDLPDNTVACEICGTSTPRPIAKCVECNRASSPLSLPSQVARNVAVAPVNLYGKKPATKFARI